MLKIQIKASQITNLTDARYFAAREVNYLGFCLDSGSDYFISPQQVKAITEWVEGPQMVGEFGLQEPEDIIKAIEWLELDAVQLSQFTSMNGSQLPKGVDVIREVVIENIEQLSDMIQFCQSNSQHVDTFLLNFDKNGINWPSLQQAPKNLLADLKSLCNQQSIFWSIDLSSESIDQILAEIPVNGFNVAGGEEEKVGFKSFDALDDIFDGIEILED